MAQPIILVMHKINGYGGKIKSKDPIHCHFEPFKNEKTFCLSKQNSQDNLFFRHLTIYLLDKYFRATGQYSNRHIPAPLGLLYDKHIPIGILSEHVYGLESSSYYNEHPDWETASKEFARFGFPRLDCDYHEGFSEEFGTVDHNHFKQDEYFPDEIVRTFEAPQNMSWLKDRYSTPRWMRIDFGHDSFTFNEKDFIKNFDNKKNYFENFLSSHEYYYLSQYRRILEGKTIEDQNKFIKCIKEIRKDCLKVVYESQIDLLKRQEATNIINSTTTDKTNLTKEYRLKKFLKLMTGVFAKHTLADLREMDQFHDYIYQNQLQFVEYIQRKVPGYICDSDSSGDEQRHNINKFFNTSNKHEQYSEIPLHLLEPVSKADEGYVEKDIAEDISNLTISLSKLFPK